MSRFCPSQDWGSGGGRSKECEGRKGDRKAKDKSHRWDEQRRKRHNGFGLADCDKQIIRTHQKGRSFFGDDPIYDFHHCPPMAELLERRKKPSGLEIAIGVSNIDHALCHQAEYELTGNQTHLQEAVSILGRYDNEVDTEAATGIFEERLCSEYFDKVVAFVRARRLKYGLPCREYQSKAEGFQTVSAELKPRGANVHYID